MFEDPAQARTSELAVAQGEGNFSQALQKFLQTRFRIGLVKALDGDGFIGQSNAASQDARILGRLIHPALKRMFIHVFKLLEASSRAGRTSCAPVEACKP